jgi:transglutaminase-like putative cysteine protease
MELNRLFKRCVFCQVLLGILALGFAEENLLLLLAAGSVSCMSWFVTEGANPRPLPRWLLLLAATAGVLYLPFEVFRSRGELVIAVGHFLLWLQITLLYGEKANRDYGQLLMLSLLQIIAATALSSRSPNLLFAVLLLTYCGTGMFTALLFHFKLSADAVHEATARAAPDAMTVEPPRTVVGHGHRWHLRLSAMAIGAGCAGFSILVFILIPRGDPHELALGALGANAPRRSGFASVMRLTGEPSNLGDADPVLSVQLQGRSFGPSGMDRLLRGAVLDDYDILSHTWTAAQTPPSQFIPIDLTRGPQPLTRFPAGSIARRMSITLFETVDRKLFAPLGVAIVSSKDQPIVLFNVRDGLIEVDEPLLFPVVYDVEVVETPVRLAPPPLAGPQPGPREPLRRRTETFSIFDDPATADDRRPWQVAPGRFATLARQILTDAGLQRGPGVPPAAADERIARALTTYLKKNHRYALVNPKPPRGSDPVEQFLFQTRAGHCELFAAGLAALSRSLGMRARVVLGYRISEFNRIGGYHLARRRNAHAWTEIFCGSLGWRSFDATPPDALAAEHDAPTGAMGLLRELYLHIEFAFVQSITTYNEDRRGAMLGRVSHTVRGFTIDSPWWDGLAWAWNRVVLAWRGDRLALIFMALIIFFIAVGLATLVRILMVRRRRVVTLQLTCLPRSQRRQLARRLRFYLIMLDKLERHGFVRPNWQSPFSFAEQIAAKDPVRFGPVVALTELFYEVRFGYRPLDAERRNRIQSYLRGLDSTLTSKA